jgi:hypothetical protein
MADKQFADEGLVGLRDALGQLSAGDVLALALVLGRNDDVDAVRLATDLFVDPGEFVFQLFGVNAVPPSTPRPPALVTAATTSRQ